jgi:hypothetical protein
VPDPRRHPVGLVDTSVVIDLESIDEQHLPEGLAISALTMAELAAGPHATDDTPRSEPAGKSGCSGPRPRSIRSPLTNRRLGRTGASTPRWRRPGEKHEAREPSTF